MTTSPAELKGDADFVSRPDLPSHHIGEYECGRPGPMLLFVGGMHGNEPAGVRALQHVLAELEQRNLPLRGRLICLAGNLEALRRGTRYIDLDLNRVWTAAPAATEPRTECHESEVQRGFQELIEELIADVDEAVVFLDLHSTSAGGAPFTIIGDTRQNRRIALALPVPAILGLEESVDGALLGYFGERGHLAIGFEGGQHDDPATVVNHIAATWITLITAGALHAEEVPEAAASFERLRAVARGLPGVVEMRYRHHVEPGDEFVMRAGYTNFDRVRAGEVLAHDVNGDITSREDGLILLPLYQGLGEDGFFVGREVRRVWLRVSSFMRVLRLGRLLRLFPGVRRVSGAVETLEVDPGVARWWVVEIFHLLGYRRLRSRNDKLRFRRRVGAFEPRRKQD